MKILKQRTLLRAFLVQVCRVTKVCSIEWAGVGVECWEREREYLMKILGVGNPKCQHHLRFLRFYASYIQRVRNI